MRYLYLLDQSHDDRQRFVEDMKRVLREMRAHGRAMDIQDALNWFGAVWEFEPYLADNVLAAHALFCCVFYAVEKEKAFEKEKD